MDEGLRLSDMKLENPSIFGIDILCRKSDLQTFECSHLYPNIKDNTMVFHHLKIKI